MSEYRQTPGISEELFLYLLLILILLNFIDNLPAHAYKRKQTN